MKEIKGYTPGEWEIVNNEDITPSEIFIAVKNSNGIFEHPVCDVYFMNNKQGKQNATLIAAAPQLMEENLRLSKQVKELREALGNALDYWQPKAESDGNFEQTEYTLYMKAFAALKQTEQ